MTEGVLDKSVVSVIRIAELKGEKIMQLQHVSGRNAGHIILYALSTCPWCKKTKKLLADLGVDYYYVDVDLLDENEREEVVETIKQWNPARSYPTLVINSKIPIVGFKENEIRKAVQT